MTLKAQSYSWIRHSALTAICIVLLSACTDQNSARLLGPGNNGANKQTPYQSDRLVSQVAISGMRAVALSADRKTLYFFWNKKGPSETVLSTFDISNPRTPKRTSDVNVGPAGRYTYAVARRSRLFFLSGEEHPSTIIFDINEPHSPKQVGSIPDFLALEVSADGTFLTGYSEASIDRVGYDLANPSKPTRLGTIPRQGLLEAVRDYTCLPEHCDLSVGDRYGSNVLLDADALEIWHDTGAGTHTLSKKLAVGFFPDEVRLLDLDANLLLAVSTNFFGIYSTGPLTVTNERLRRLLNVRQEYATALSQQITPPYPILVAPQFVAQLEDAGVNSLTDRLPAGLSTDERVELLYSYGFLLNQMEQGERGLPTLRQAVAIAPDRVDVARSLFDAARQAMKRAETDTAKLSFWREARNAYRTYIALGGTHESGGDQFAGFDLEISAARASGVCQFISDAYNHSDMDYIVVREVTTAIGNALHHITIAPGKGSCSSNYIKIDDEKFGSYLWPRTDPKPDDITIIPFRGSIYFVTLVEGAPYRVIRADHAFADDAEGGTVCGFKRSFTPTLTENRSERVCRKFLTGELTDEPEWKRPPPGGIPDAFVSGLNFGQFQFNSIADVKLGQSDQITRLGHFTTPGGGGCGYSVQGVAVLKGTTMIEGEPNTSLLEVELDPHKDAGLLRSDGRTYVHVWGFSPVGATERPGTLLELADGKFRPVCRVAQSITLEPAPPP